MIRLYATTGSSFARLEERGDEWTAELALDDTGAQCVAVDPNGAGTVYVGCRGRGVHRSDDGGRTWTDLSLPQHDVFSVAVSPVDGAVYAGCEPSMLFRSTDRGATWEELTALRELPSAPTWSFPPRPWTSHVRWIAPSPHDAAVLLVGIELGGLMRSDDGGRTWADHAPGAQKDVHSLAWHPSSEGRAYEAGGGGAAWSVDGGLTWQPADDGRDRHYTWAVAVDPADAEVWFVSASPGPFHAHRPGRADAYVYRRQDGGSWERLDGGLPQPLDAMPYALVFAGGRLFGGLSDGRLYASPDRGDSWEELPVEPRLPAITALAA